MDEFSRTELLIGAAGLKKLKACTVLVFGIGGVGSHCVEALARCGVGRLVLVDSDVVSPTNINRQVIALGSTVGRYKTEVMRERIRDICPDIEVITHETFVLKDNLGELLESSPDYIIDAIDTVSAKLAIAEAAREKGIPLISSMGTGNKLHGELFRIGDIYETSVCPLCRVMRRELKKRNIPALKVLYSTEQPVDTAANRREEENGERPLPGSISFVPPVAGLLIAGEAVRDLLEISFYMEE